MTKIDFHVHTSYSPDAFNDPFKIVKHAKRKGLDGIAITDHNNLKAINIIPKEKDFLLISGCEFKTIEGDLIGIFISNLPKKTTMIETIEWIHEENGLSILPHPFGFREQKWTKEEDFDEVIKKVDGIEAFNSRNLSIKDNDKASKLAKTSKKTIISSSDAHFQFEIGNAFTFFENCEDYEQLYKNFRKGSKDIHGKMTPQVNHLFSTSIKIMKKIFPPALTVIKTLSGI